MPADRHQRKKARTSTNAEAGPSSAPAFKIPALEQRGADALPGVNKIKASLRQAKRLLNKENLEPSLRISTQRRVAALEADLAAAEKRDVEKKNGAKYHAVKFFERQKLGRIIKRAQRKVAEAEKDGKAKKTAKAEQELRDARVMLNYVLNYPNTIKYISLFPKEEKREEGDDKEKLKVPKYLQAELSDVMEKSERTRLTMLLETRKLMEEGKLSSTPEVERERRPVELAAVVEAGTAGGTKRKAAKAEEKEEADDFFDSD
ncbi:hypothetical protein CC85DRAFT_283429 [Cutaneotrichosporon oleaginosum]|uniref:rRNA-processing protein EFG1 n=1 Tax=Cutaneotrichosporon oleaginosum TaxID=879819 RepID=A0A0J0XTU7_9TREE|nr:uncharacterized protein CC85DRAFT_283429 [Cutaneotrichosporon oleaginosum]KLT44490.1 hypothetical protein CC85DRAFT_283429 [Cutaneotrichosporon oleaginosum]TXT13991.1 hypothetical protein COLE_00184 [Cutaneotrichosporon oleaginosum]